MTKIQMMMTWVMTTAMRMMTVVMIAALDVATDMS